MATSGFFCPDWVPWDPKSEFSQHFGYPTPWCSDTEAIVSDRRIVGTVAHEAIVIYINYAENECPTVLTAVTQGITVAAASWVFLIFLYSLLNVLCGCTRRLRRGQSLDWGGMQKDGIDDVPVLLPTATSNFREVVELKDDVADLKTVVARLQRELLDRKEGGSASQASAPAAEGGALPRMYYPSSGSSDVEATGSELGDRELALVRQGRSRTMGAAAIIRRSRTMGSAPPAEQSSIGGRRRTRPAEERPLRTAPTRQSAQTREGVRGETGQGEDPSGDETETLVGSGSGSGARARGSGQISSQYGAIGRSTTISMSSGGSGLISLGSVPQTKSTPVRNHMKTREIQS